MDVVKFTYPDLAQLQERKLVKARVAPGLAAGKIANESNLDAAIPEVVAPPPEPTITVKEHEAEKERVRESARAEGKAAGEKEGYEKGLEEGRGEVKALDERIIALLEGMAVQYDGFAHQVTEYQTSYTKESIVLAKEIARKVTVDTLSTHAEGIIEATLAKAFSFLSEVPEITIFVNPRLTNNLQDRVQSLGRQGQKSPVRAQITIKPDESLEEADCRVEWSNGVLERKTQTVWERIDALYQDVIKSGNASMASPAAEAPQAETPGEVQE
jgi:flagellar assembly protein FliH